MTKSCRYCLDSNEQHDFIIPCKCKGSIKYVHRKCLDEWRASDVEGNRFKQCDICKFNYILVKNETSSWIRYIKYILYISLDIILLFFIINFILCILSGIFYLLDFNSSIKLFIGYNSSFICYYIFSLSMALLLIGFIGLQFIGIDNINNRINLGGSYGNIKEIFYAIAFIIMIVGFILGVIAFCEYVSNSMSNRFQKIYMKLETEVWIVNSLEN